MTTFWTDYFEQIKTWDPEPHFISDVEPQKIYKAITSWSMSGAQFTPLASPFPEEPNDRFWWIWGGVSFDPMKWVFNMGFEPFHGFLPRLIQSLLIYPDGTYNKAWVETMLKFTTERQKEKLNGSTGSGARAGS